MTLPNENTLRVRKAFRSLATLLPSYYEQMYRMRAGLTDAALPNPEALGSVYPDYPANKLKVALEEFAIFEPYTHPAILPQCTAFQTRLTGVVGVIPLKDLPPGSLIELHDPKPTGEFEACVRLPRDGRTSPTTIVILEPEEGVEIVTTFFPGDPIPPSKMPSEGRNFGTITVECAMNEHGLTHAKVMG